MAKTLDEDPGDLNDDMFQSAVIRLSCDLFQADKILWAGSVGLKAEKAAKVSSRIDKPFHLLASLEWGSNFWSWHCVTAR